MPTMEDSDSVVDEFEALLAEHRVAVTQGSRLEDALLFVRHVLHVREGSEISDEDDCTKWREMIGVLDLARRLIWVARNRSERLKWLLPWLRLFASAKGQLAQTAPTSAGDQDSDKVFELLVALCLLPGLLDLAPDRGRGDNPDLLFQFEGRRWGVACKRLYSTQPARFRDTVSNAIQQIERSDAERGLVFVSLTNVINHDNFYSLRDDSYVGHTREAMIEILDAEQNRLQADLVGCTDVELADAFKGKKALPGIIHYLGTTYLTGSGDAPVLKTVQRAWSRGDVGPFLGLFQAGLNSTSSVNDE